MHKISVAIVALALALTACGSDAEPTEPVVTTAAPTTVPTTVATTAPPTTAPTTTEWSGEQAGSEYCLLALEIDQLGQNGEDFGRPEVLEEYLTQLSALYERAFAAAPPEIAADLEVQRDLIVEVETLVGAGDYQFAAMLDALDTTGSDERDASALAVRGYNQDQCGAP